MGAIEGAIVQVRDDGTIVYRASAIASCVKALVAARLEYAQKPPPKDFVTRANEGYLHEDDVIRRMETEGFVITGQQQSVELIVSKSVKVVGHIDGIADNTNITDSVFDVKSQSKDQWDDFENRGWESGLFPKYKWQFSVYMHALQLPGLLVRKNRNDGRIKYHIIPEPFYSLTDIRRRVLEVEAWAMRGELPEKCDTQMYPCPVYYLHDDKEFAAIDDELVEKLAIQYESSKRDEKVAKNKKDSARKALREQMGLRLVDGKVEADEGVPLSVSTNNGTKVTFYNQKNPNPSTNWTAIQTALGVDRDEFSNQYQVSTESERLRITLPKEGESNGS